MAFRSFQIWAGVIAFSFAGDVAFAAAAARSAPAASADRATILNPDWLPESKVVATPIPSTGDFYVAPNGSDANSGSIDKPFQTIQKAVNSAKPGSVILVRGGTYKQRVTFARANSGSEGRTITLAAYPRERAILDGTGIALPRLSGLIEIAGEYIRVNGFTIQNVGGDDGQMGILINQGAHVVVDGNRTQRTASAGIGAWYSESFIIRGNLIQDARTTGSQECLSVNDGAQFEISFNEVWNTRAWPQRCEGIDIKNGAEHGRVVGNIAHDLPLECIYIDAFEEDTHDIDVYANTSYNCSIGIAMTSEVRGHLRNIRVFNNLIYDTFFIGIGFPAWGGSPNAGAISDVAVTNNTIDNARARYKENHTGFYFAYPKTSRVTIRNNIVTTPSPAFKFEQTPAELVVDHNLVVAPSLSSGMTINDPAVVRANPKWRRGYRLSADSPAISAANRSVAIGFDHDGKPRPQGPGLDIGAFEYSP